MFCLYCGNNLPDDALFCNKCGKQQKSPTNSSTSDVVILPNPLLSNIPLIVGHPTPSNIPMVQGTPQVSGIPSIQGALSTPVNAPAGNAASSPPPSSGLPSMPSQAPSPAFPVDLSHGYEQHIDPRPGNLHPPHNTELRSSLTNKQRVRHHEQSGMEHTGLKVAGHLSRRAIIVGLTGITGLAVAGGGLAWLTLSRRPQASSLTSTPPPVPLGTTLLTYTGHSTTVNTVTWSPDGKYIASGAFDKTVQVWDAASGNKALTYRGHSSSLFKVRWSPDGKRIASGGGFNAEPNHGDTTVQVWDALTGSNALIYRGHSGWVDNIAWSPDGQRITSYGVGESTVQVWDATTGSTLFAYGGQAAEIVVSVAWSPDGRYVASSGYTGTGQAGTVQIWDPTNGNTILTISDDWGEVTWSSDSRYFAIGSQDLQIRDAATGTRVSTFTDYASGFFATWSPDGRFIASGGEKTAIRDASSGKVKLVYPNHKDLIFDLSWSPDSKRIATANRDGTVLVWQAS